MSLVIPHPIWTTCGSNPYEVNKATVQARMLSGRYVTDQLSRPWKANSRGICTIPTCSGSDIGSLEHLLLFCPGLSDDRARILNLFTTVAAEAHELFFIIDSFLNSDTTDTRMQFLLDCSTLPEVIRLRQSTGDSLLARLFFLTRTWCYTIHRSRMTKLGLLQFR